MSGLNVPDSPVFDEWQHQKAIDPDRFDLTALWIAAGRKPSMSPRRCLKGYHLEDPGGGAGVPIHGDYFVAFVYVQRLDCRIAFAVNELVFKMMRQDPTKVSMDGEGGPLVAMFAVSAERDMRGGSVDEAADRIVREVAERTEGEGVWRQETRVAEAQRAVEPGRRMIHLRSGEGQA